MEKTRQDFQKKIVCVESYYYNYLSVYNNNACFFKYLYIRLVLKLKILGFLKLIGRVFEDCRL